MALHGMHQLGGRLPRLWHPLRSPLRNNPQQEETAHVHSGEGAALQQEVQQEVVGRS